MQAVFWVSLVIVVCWLLASAPTGALAQTPYTVLEPIQGFIEPTTNASAYISGAFRLVIAIATALAVIMIIVGGIKYMSTDAFSGKNEAKETIKNALWGLFLAMGAWLILFTINPDLVQFDLSIQSQPLPAASGGGGGIVVGNCTNCGAIGVPIAPGSVCRPQTPGGACTIDASLNARLMDLNNRYNGDFEVTEAWPPTRPHSNECHSVGTCVDVGLGLNRNRSPQNNPQNIISFINAANAAGLRAVFEVPTEAQAQALRNAGVPANNIQPVPNITSPHFSVYTN